MNHTPAFNLSQWDPTDRIFMRDFNSDNAIIDAALSTRPQLVELMNVTETLNGASNWYKAVDTEKLSNSFAFFIEYIRPKTKAVTYKVDVPGALSNAGELIAPCGCLFGFPLRNPAQAIYLRPAGGFRVADHTNINPYSTFTGLNLYPVSSGVTLTGEFTLRIYIIP